jgi:hypothetical protein
MLTGVNGSTNVVIPMSVLIGNTNGYIDVVDVSIAKSSVGTGLP